MSWPYNRWRGAGPPLGEPFQMNRDSEQSDGLVFWLPMLGMDAGSMRFVDRVGGLSLAPYNSPAWTPDGWLGNTLLFDDGSSQYLQVVSAVVSGPPFTMACWFNHNDAGHLHTMMSVGDGGANFHSLRKPGWTVLSAYSYTVGANGAAGATITPAINTWYHGLGIWTAVDNRACYVNGGNKGTNSTSVSPSGMDRTAISARLNGADCMSGMIADARIYNVAKSDAAAAQMYDPLTRWELYEPERKIWTGWSEEEIGAVTAAIYYRRRRV